MGVTENLKGAMQTWLIWVHMNLKFKYRQTISREYFTNSFTEEVFESENISTSTEILLQYKMLMTKSQI